MRTRIKKQQHDVLYTDYFFVNAPKLFARCNWYGKNNENRINLEVFDRDWNPYYFEGRRVALAASLWLGSVGIEGEFELAIPPARESIDTLGYSISEGDLDRWDFLRLSAAPEGNYEVSLLLSFARNTFFDRALDKINIFDSESICGEMDAITGTLGLQGAWEGLWRILQRTVEAELADQRLETLRTRGFFLGDSV